MKKIRDKIRHKNAQFILKLYDKTQSELRSRLRKLSPEQKSVLGLSDPSVMYMFENIVENSVKQKEIFKLIRRNVLLEEKVKALSVE